MQVRVNPRSITDAERPWLAAWSPGVQSQLIDLLQVSVSNALTRNVVGWLAMKSLGHDIADATSKARYRGILRQLAEDGIEPDGPPRMLVITSSSRAVNRHQGEPASRRALVLV